MQNICQRIKYNHTAFLNSCMYPIQSQFSFRTEGLCLIVCRLLPSHMPARNNNNNPSPFIAVTICVGNCSSLPALQVFDIFAATTTTRRRRHQHKNFGFDHSSLPALKLCAIFMLVVCCPRICHFAAITVRRHPITTTIVRPIFAATTTTRRRRHQHKNFGFDHSSLPALKVCAIFMLVVCCPHISHFAAITETSSHHHNNCTSNFCSNNNNTSSPPSP